MASRGRSGAMKDRVEERARELFAEWRGQQEASPETGMQVRLASLQAVIDSKLPLEGADVLAKAQEWADWVMTGQRPTPSGETQKTE